MDDALPLDGRRPTLASTLTDWQLQHLTRKVQDLRTLFCSCDCPDYTVDDTTCWYRAPYCYVYMSLDGVCGFRYVSPDAVLQQAMIAFQYHIEMRHDATVTFNAWGLKRNMDHTDWLHGSIVKLDELLNIMDLQPVPPPAENAWQLTTGMCWEELTNRTSEFIVISNAHRSGLRCEVWIGLSPPSREPNTLRQQLYDGDLAPFNFSDERPKVYIWRRSL